MRFENYITESRSRDLKREEFEKLVRTKYSDAAKRTIENKDGSVIYRGVMDVGRYAITDPSVGKPRTSANTSNEYTLLIDNLKVWSDYPKRSRSVVCTTASSYSQNYGDIYIVLPMNGTKIGECSGKDFWESFPYTNKVMGIYDMDDFNMVLKFLFRVATGEEKHDNNWSTLNHAMKEFDKKFKDEFDENWMRMFSELTDEYWTKSVYYWKNAWKGTFEKTVSDILDPKKNRFKLKKSGNSFGGYNELWVGGPCLMISTEYGGHKEAIKYLYRIINEE